jgi:hypothetical protein
MYIRGSYRIGFSDVEFLPCTELVLSLNSVQGGVTIVGRLPTAPRGPSRCRTVHRHTSPLQGDTVTMPTHVPLKSAVVNPSRWRMAGSPSSSS